MKSSLERFMGASPLNETELYARMKDLWLKTGTVMFTQEDIQKMDTLHAMTIEAAAIIKYGKRK